MCFHPQCYVTDIAKVSVYNIARRRMEGVQVQLHSF